MTPRQLSAMWEAWKLRERSWDRRAALMPWLYAESHRDRKARADPWRIEDFMPGEQKREPTGQVDSEQVFAVGATPMGVTRKSITAEELQAIAAQEDFASKAERLKTIQAAMSKRYTGPNGQQPGR